MSFWELMGWVFLGWLGFMGTFLVLWHWGEKWSHTKSDRVWR